ncbi:MAG TPA: hypothetical protein VMT63_09600 [Bacteroidales bacterium]|nr:hypothetical protein [Bacteroidales bacterium]
MKRLLFPLVIMLVPFALKAQAPFPSKDEIAQFMSSKTCIVLEDDPFSSFNANVREAVKSFWTITSYEFISIVEFNKRRTDPAYSFIVLTQTNYEKDKTGGLFNFINLLEGKKVNDLGLNPEICAVPLSFAGVDDTEYGYKLGIILAFMQKHARLIAEDPSKTGRKYLKYYNDNAPGVVGKTILFKEEDLAPDINTEDAIKAVYPFAFRIVSEEEIQKAIEEKRANTLILHKVGPVGDNKAGYCFKMLIGADDSQMYYYNQHMANSKNPNGFLKADLERLARYK